MTSAVAHSSSPAAPAKVHEAFDWVRSQRIESLSVVVEEYRHRVTGALHYHLAASNPENVFLVAFRTVPQDSTGVAHILEHTVLCGSKHYPVRDPFFMMTRRSLNTFMNAFTSSDWTAYPFASQNRKDFYNLMDVYLDAVFFARLHELDFAQEGHRLEFAELANPGSELMFKGVVFNEMKGAMSSPVNTLWQTLTRYLFPTTTYHHNSGGDPEHIPDLSWADLKEFYRTHYHPSNAIFMTYGNIPAADHQGRIQEKALAQFQALDVHIAVPDEKRYQAPVRVQESYAADEESGAAGKTHVVVGWLLGHSTNLKQQLEAHLLEGVLLDDSASPLRHALETTDLGSAPSPLCGLEASNREMSFICGLEGSKTEHADAVESLVTGVLENVVENGIPRERVEAVLHQLELSQREIAGDGYPYGLQLILGGLSNAIHGGDPVALLNLDPVLEELRGDIQNPEYIRSLVRDRLLNNFHRVRLTLVPDPTLSERRKEAEQARLRRIKAGLSDSEQRHLVAQAQALAERQQQADDPNLLPRVGLEDVPAEMPIPTGETGAICRRPASFYARGTNGLVYQQLVVEFPQIAEALLDILPYYTHSLAQLGCGSRDYLETQALQSSVSGGIHASTSMRAAIDDVQAVRGHFVVSGKSLVRNHAALSELMLETFEAPRFDELERMRDLMAQQRAQREQSVTGHGHSLAMLAASSGMSAGAAIAHRLRGLQGIHYLKGMDDQLDDKDRLSELAQRFEELHEALRAAPRQFLLIAEAERLSQARQDMELAWSKADSPLASVTRFVPVAVHRQVREAWIANTEVNFCAKAYPTVPVEHPDAAALAVLAGFLRNGYLHRAVREQGGAYGGGASHDPDNAAFRFYSYRDPRLEETLQEFDRAIAWLLEEKHEWRPVEEAILGVVAAMDRPGSPAGEAKDAFYNSLYGRTPEQRQRVRKRVLAVTLDDLQRVGATYFDPAQASVAVITGQPGEAVCERLGLDIRQL